MKWSCGRGVLLSLSVVAASAATTVGLAASGIEDVGGRSCKPGEHVQPGGPFSVYVFCDDALGTNIAVLYGAAGDPRYNKWTLTRRFWQGDPWAADVHGLGWVPGSNLLVVTTSEIYGEGEIFLLNLEEQTFKVLASPKDCGSKILKLTEHEITVGTNDCEHPQPKTTMHITF